jgi:flavin-dependent dehydrogenase
VGAGPAGIYLGWQLGKKGRSILILDQDSREKIASKMDQFHMDSYTFEEFGVPPPEQGSEEFITTIEETCHYSPFGKYHRVMKWRNHALRFPFFIRRLIRLAEADGVKFQFSSKFRNCTFNNGTLAGVHIEQNGKDLELKGRIIVDTTGSAAIIRSSLPENYGIETFKIADDEKMYVIQRVIQWKKPDEPHPGKEYKSNTWMYYKTWIAPHFFPNANIFGNGQPGGFQNTEKAVKLFLNNIQFPPYELIEQHRAITVYRRSPYSLVADGFLCLGDSACMTKPFNGEGISLTWPVCRSAAEVIDKALQRPEYITKELLWQINIDYFRNNGAKMAALLAQMPGAANTTKKEMEYLYKTNVIFSGKDFEDMNNYYELHIGFGRMLKIILIFLWGILTNHFSRATFKSMLNSMKIAAKIRKHYEEFPEHPRDFDQWVEKAEELWKPVPKMKFTLKE